jgi:hypothetical protein
MEILSLDLKPYKVSKWINKIVDNRWVWIPTYILMLINVLWPQVKYEL